MIRVEMGPPVSRWWYFFLFVIGSNAVSGMLDGEGARTVLAVGALVCGATQIVRSLRWARICWVVAVGAMVLAAVLGYLQQDWYWTVFATLFVLLVLALSPLILRGVPSNRFPTEELVGRSVADARRLLGFTKGRQPDGLQEPMLIPVPAGEVGMDSEDMVITAVSVEPTSATINFGVAPNVSAPDLSRKARREWQRRLVAQVGGFPADIRPLLSPARARATTGG